MNTWILHKAQRYKYRKYALRISLIAHVLMFLTIPFIFIQQQIQEMEDEIAVELIEELPRQVVQKKPPPKEKPPAPEPPKPEMPELEEITPQRKEVTLQKEVNVVQHKASLEIAKLPASAAAVEIEQPASQNVDVETPILETEDFATDAQLEPTIDSVVSPKVSADVGYGQSGYTKRRDTGVKSPTKNTGDGIRKGTQKTGAATGNDIGHISDIRSAGNGSGGTGNGSGGTGNGEGNATFSSVIAELTDDIIASSGGLPIDVVFVVDASGSMLDNINAVADHLGQMVDAYKASEIDYQLGLTYFNTDHRNNIHVFQLTRDLPTYKQALLAIVPTGGENALDAIHQTVDQMRFRKKTIKHLIVVTDEPFSSMQGHTVHTIIQLCGKKELLVNVLGIDTSDHKHLAEETGGTWQAVPSVFVGQTKRIAQIAQSAVNAQTIGTIILADGANNPVDIILFIDSSKSMEDKVPYIKEQIDLWIRNWDNANIEYRLGAVRFRTKQNVNIVNVFKPSQTQKKIHSILKLPYSDDENLLYAIKDAIRQLEQRPNAKTHFILITDEPGDPAQLGAEYIALLKELPVTVSVIGAADNFQLSVASQTGGVYVKMPNAYNINNGGE